MSRNFLCRCEDIDTEEVEEAIQEGFDDLESLRRYTAIGTGPCQGKACIQETIRMLADHHGVEEQEIGQMTLRPPFTPIPLGHLSALDDQDLKRLFGATGTIQEEEAGPARTGRPTPEQVERQLEEHRKTQESQEDTSRAKSNEGEA
jgi:bacterioferritin-associated ferredoxin